MKKIILLFFLVCITTAALCGCSHKKQIDVKEVTFWTLQMGDFSDYINDIIKNYETINPTIRIKWVDVPFSEGEKRTLAAVMTDNPPDLINLNADFSSLLAQKNTLEEIDLKTVNSFHPEVINLLKYNNKLYSIPWYATSAVTIYNNELFKQSGLVRTPKTYDEVASVAKTVKDKTGRYVFLPTVTENDTLLKILNKYGVADFSELNSEKSIHVFEMFKTLYKNNLIPPESISFTLREAMEQYMAGKIVFFQGGANFLNLIRENAPSVYSQTLVTEQFVGSVGQYDVSVMNFVIPKRAKYKKEALDFCLYLTNAENQLNLAKRTNIIATDTAALQSPFYNDYSDLIAKARSISAKQLNNIYPQIKQRRNQKEINNLINNAMQMIMLKKDDTKTVLDKLSSDLKNLE